ASSPARPRRGRASRGRARGGAGARLDPGDQRAAARGRGGALRPGGGGGISRSPRHRSLHPLGPPRGAAGGGAPARPQAGGARGEKPWARVEVRSSLEDRDPALLVDVEMSPLSVPELAFVQITDPAGPRFAIDRDLDGRDTLFGTASRNIPEEMRAMQAGLA